jgi:proteasome assembly chaperone (PAC2) family protein
MDPVTWSERPQLRNPALVCAFRGWNDAGEAATAAVGFLIERFGAQEFARIDGEEFFDFSTIRPTVSFDEGRSRVLEWPTNALHAAHVEGADCDLVLLQGVEPSLRWRAFTDTVVGIANELGVGSVITMGALLADVPHSRPVSVTGFASDTALVERLGFGQSSYEGPTGIVGVLQHAFTELNMSAASLWASVPHYVAATPNPKAALALLRRFEGAVGVAVDATDLEEAAEEYERQVNAAVASDPNVKAFVERLEESIDQQEEEASESQDVPSADAIARDFQRFLRQRGSGGEGAA